MVIYIFLYVDDGSRGFFYDKSQKKKAFMIMTNKFIHRLVPTFHMNWKHLGPKNKGKSNFT